MKTPFIVAGLVLLVVVSTVVDAQTSCTSDTCVVNVENARTILQQNLTAHSISPDKCQNVSATITLSIAACRSTWTANSCPNATIAPLDARLTNVSNFLKTACSAQQDCNATVLGAAQAAMSACQPKTFSALNISGVNSRITICKSVQTTLDCITKAAAPCLSSLSTVANFQLLYNIYLGLWFDCSMTIGGTTVSNTFTAVCSYPKFTKCYNPLLKVLGKQTIDDNFDYNYLSSSTGLGVGDLLSYNNQAKYCGMIGTNFDWNSLKSCVQAASVNCGEALGESPSIPLGDLETIWDNMFALVSASLKSLELLADMCGTGCSNIASRSTAQGACVNPATPAAAVLANYNTDITAACRSLSQSITCINNASAGCNLLREDIYYNYLSGGNQVSIQTAAYLCGLSLDAKLPWEVCRNKQAAKEAGNIELRCVTTGLMLKNNQGTGIPGVDYVMTAISIMLQCSQWKCWQNEAAYITPILPFAAVMQTVYNSSIVPKLGGVSAVALKGHQCVIC